MTPTFAWNTITGVSSYTVYIADQAGGAPIVIANQAGPTYNQTALTAGHTYTWWLGAVVGQTTNWNSGLTFTIGATPTAPSGPITTLTPTFSWNTITGATSYSVYILDQASGQAQVFNNLSGSPWNSQAVLAAGHAYTWWIGAVLNGSTLWSSGDNFSIPLIPTGPTSPQTTLAPTFTWNTITGAGTYTVYISDQAGGAAQLFTGLTGPSWNSQATLLPGHSYTWWLGAGQGASTVWSSGQNFSIPSTASVTSANTTTPTFSWNQITGVASYTVYIADQAGGSPKIISSLTGSSYNQATLTVGHAYTWWLGAVVGQTTTWNSGQAFTIGPTTIGPSGPINTLTPTFSWGTLSGAASYSVYIQDQAGGPAQVFNNLSGSTYNQATLAAGHAYTWWIGAVLNGSTIWSSGQTFSIPLTATSPSGTISNALPTFTWNSIPGVSSYTVYLLDETSGVTQIFNNQTSGGSTPLTNALTLGDIYIWWVGAVQGLTTSWDVGLTFTILA